MTEVGLQRQEKRLKHDDASISFIDIFYQFPRRKFTVTWSVHVFMISEVGPGLHKMRTKMFVDFLISDLRSEEGVISIDCQKLFSTCPNFLLVFMPA